MNIFTGFVVYFLTWWVVLFAVLPLGITHREEQAQGAMHGAPDKPNAKRVIIITSVVSAVIWVIIYALVKSDMISFRAMAEAMQ